MIETQFPQEFSNSVLKISLLVRAHELSVLVNIVLPFNPELKTPNFHSNQYARTWKFSLGEAEFFTCPYIRGTLRLATLFPVTGIELNFRLDSDSSWC